MTVQNLHAFWSYSRASEFHGGAELHAAMQASMTEAMAPHTLAIFRDTAPALGLDVGSDWPREMVRAVSRSALFFWIQSPRWLQQAFCRFEFVAFRDRVARAARRIAPGNEQAAFEDLWSSMVVPVRWLEATDEAWAAVSGEEGAVVADAWHRLQVIAPLHLSRPRLTGLWAGDLYSPACKESAAAIQKKLSATMRRWGITPASWAEMVEYDSHAFEEAWLRELIDRGLLEATNTARTSPALPPLSLVEAQVALARRMTDGATDSERGRLGLTMVLVPSPDDAGNGLWCSSAPVPNRLASEWTRWLGDGFRAIPGTNGALRWSIEAVAAALPQLQAEGVDLPDAGQAAVLLGLAAQNRSTLHRLGLQSVPQDFWYRSPDGSLSLAGGTRTRTGSLVLVSDL